MKSLGFTHERREKRSPAPATQNTAPAVRGGGGGGVRVGAGRPLSVPPVRKTGRRSGTHGQARSPGAARGLGGVVSRLLPQALLQSRGPRDGRQQVNAGGEEARPPWPCAAGALSAWEKRALMRFSPGCGGSDPGRGCEPSEKPALAASAKPAASLPRRAASRPRGSLRGSGHSRACGRGRSLGCPSVRGCRTALPARGERCPGAGGAGPGAATRACPAARRVSPRNFHLLGNRSASGWLI